MLTISGATSSPLHGFRERKSTEKGRATILKNFAAALIMATLAACGPGKGSLYDPVDFEVTNSGVVEVLQVSMAHQDFVDGNTEAPEIHYYEFTVDPGETETGTSIGQWLVFTFRNADGDSVTCTPEADERTAFYVKFQVNADTLEVNDPSGYTCR